MKNIYLLPTTRPSKLYKQANELRLRFIADSPIDSDISINQHIYITSDEEIKEGDWKYCLNDDVIKIQKQGGSFVDKDEFKIILTTDQTRIKDGVQAINNEFLGWFVNNTSCEYVEVKKRFSDFTVEPFIGYKIIIPKEEPKPRHQQIIDAVGGEDRFREIAGIKPKQETLEEYIKEVTKNFGNEMSIKFTSGGIKLGAKWQQERMYSEKDIIDLIQFLSMNEDFNGYSSVSKDTAKRFLKQFKNK
jgi:hypothetical protein